MGTSQSDRGANVVDDHGTGSRAKAFSHQDGAPSTILGRFRVAVFPRYIILYDCKVNISYAILLPLSNVSLAEVDMPCPWSLDEFSSVNTRAR